MSVMFRWYAILLSLARMHPVSFRIPHTPTPMFADPATWPRWAFTECACTP